MVVGHTTTHHPADRGVPSPSIIGGPPGWLASPCHSVGGDGGTTPHHARPPPGTAPPAAPASPGLGHMNREAGGSSGGRFAATVVPAGWCGTPTACCVLHPIRCHHAAPSGHPPAGQRRGMAPRPWSRHVTWETATHNVCPPTMSWNQCGVTGGGRWVHGARVPRRSVKGGSVVTTRGWIIQRCSIMAGRRQDGGRSAPHHPLPRRVPQWGGGRWAGEMRCIGTSGLHDRAVLTPLAHRGDGGSPVTGNLDGVGLPA